MCCPETEVHWSATACRHSNNKGGIFEAIQNKIISSIKIIETHDLICSVRAGIRASQIASVGWGTRTTATTATVSREIADVFCRGLKNIISHNKIIIGKMCINSLKNPDNFKTSLQACNVAHFHKQVMSDHNGS